MAWWMYILLLIYVGACLFLIFVILLQSGKGGGLSGLASSSSGISESLGATGAERALTKLTTYCAVAFIVLAIALSWFGAKSVRNAQPILGDQPAATAPITALDELPADAIPAEGTEVTIPDAGPAGDVNIPATPGTVLPPPADIPTEQGPAE